MNLIVYFYFLLAFICPTESFKLFDQKKRTCVKVTSATCLNHVHQAYNSTFFPNLLQHKSQEEAVFELKHYVPLINIGCSKHLATFLCSLYVPVCTQDLPELIIPPCRSICYHSMRGCSPVMEEFGVKWRFDCDKFPDRKEKMCVGTDIQADNQVKEKEKKNKVKSRKGWISGNEGDTLKLRCPYGKTIHIRKVRHAQQSSCCPTATKAVLSAICNGNRSCNISVSADTLGGHCNDKIGLLALRYKCVHSLNNAINTCHQRQP